MKLKAEVNSDGARRLVVQKAGRIASSSKAALEQLGAEEVQAVQDRIRTGKTSPEGQAWRPWALATLRQRIREGTTGGGLLYKTGALYNSIKWKITSANLIIYSDSPYAQYHQNGTSRMPARPFMGWSKQGLNNFRERLRQAIKLND